MNLAQFRKPLAKVPEEVEIDALVGIDAEELSNNLNGQNLAVRELRAWATLAQLLLALKPVVNKAENCDDEGLRSTSVDLLYPGWFKTLPSAEKVSTVAQPFIETCIRHQLALA